MENYPEPSCQARKLSSGALEIRVVCNSDRRESSLGEKAVLYARSYALEAERKMGQMLIDHFLKGMVNKGTQGQLRGKDASGGAIRLPPEQDAPTLAELGLTKKESARAQLLAEIPDETFEKVKATIAAGDRKPVTTELGPRKRSRPTAKGLPKHFDKACHGQ